MASLNNYLDFAKGSDLVKSIIVLLDVEDSQSPGSILRFMRLEQADDNYSTITAYLTQDSWGCLRIRSSGIVGESKFLIDGADIKSRLNFEPWSSNPLRIRATRRKEVRLECLLNLNSNSDLIDNIESPLYSGNFDEFKVPSNITWDDSTIGYITDPFKFRKRTQILNTFSKYSNDKNSRFVWFHVENDKLAVYGSEFSGGDAGISLMKVAADLAGSVLDKETNSSSPVTKFSIPARHLKRILHLVADNTSLNFRLSDDRAYTQFWSTEGWFVFPTAPASESRTLGERAPLYLNQEFPFEKSSQRMFSAQELSYKVAMQKPKDKNDPKGVLLSCIDSHLVLTKVSDILRREVSHCLFADLSGEETDWTPIVVYQDYMLTAITAAFKFCKQFSEEELYESGDVYTDFDFEEEEQYEDENYLMLGGEQDVQSHLITITQHYLPSKDMWCVYIDPVPYSEECGIYLAASTPSRSYDQSEDNT